MPGAGTPPEPSAPQPGPSQPTPRSPTPSEREVEGGLYGDDNDEFYQNLGVPIGPDGGVTNKNLLFLLAKAVLPTASATTDPKTWGYKDVTCLPQLEQKDWHDACLRELEALEKRNVFELVD